MKNWKEDRSRFMEAVCDHFPGGVMVYRDDEEKEIIFGNQKLQRILGCRDEKDFAALTGGKLSGLLKENAVLVEKDMEGQMKAPGRRFHLVTTVALGDGSRRQVDMQGCRGEREEEKDLVFVFVTAVNEELPVYEKDHITGFPGMRQFLADSEKVVKESGHPEKYALLFFDIVHFKFFNVTYGIPEGDAFLRQIGNCLKEVFPGYFISRFDVDHFMVLADSSGVEDKIREAHSRILALRPSAKVDCKAGIYQLGRWGADPNLAVTRVKIACDSIHDSGDRFMAYYTAALDRKVELKDYVSRHMDEAVEKGYIKAYYQPIVRTVSGALCGMEALARWEDPEKGFLQPVDFISALEESRQIHKLDLEIIRQVCENFSRCMAEGRPVVPVSVNLSRLDFLQCDIFQEVENRVLEYNVPRDMIHIEITERLLNAMDSRIRQGLQRFRKAGYEIWMDDFGSGYSSLNLLKGYFFDVLKIDMAFLGSSSERARKIISSIISMDKSIGTRSLAEGVETKEQFEFLKNSGCEKVQGYFFGKPMPYEESLDHCMREGLKVETRAWKAYYDTIGMVNFQTDETLTLLEYDGRAIRYLFANSAYVDMIRTLGDHDVREAERYINDPTLELSSIFRKYLDKCTADEKVHELVYLIHDQFIKAVGRCIAQCNGRACIKIRISNITGSMTHEEEKRVYHVLHNVYAVYDDISLLDRDKDTLEPMAVSDGDWSEHEKIPHAGNCIRNYGLRNIYADDYERYMAFMDMDTLEKRIQKAGTGFLSGFFRTRVEKGRFIWMIHTLIPIPRTNYSQVLHCIHRISGNRFDFPEGLALPSENREQGMFSVEELWNSLIHGSRRAYFWKDREGRYQGASRNFLLYTGLPSVSAMKGKTSSDMGWLMDDHGARKLEGRVLSGVVVVNRPMDIIVKGVVKSIVYGKVPVYRDGEIIGTLGWFEDAEQMEKETGRQPVMVTDRVTGVMNSRGVIESLIGCQEAYRNFGSDYAMLFLTIPQYRRILHSYGEKTANGLLKAAAGKIRHIMGTRGTVGRLDGAGFVILFHYEDQTEVTFLCRKLRQAIAAIHEVGGSSCTVTAEIIITYGSDGITTGRLLREAVGMMRDSDEGYRDKMDRWVDREALFDALPIPYALLDTPMGEDGGISEIICRYHNDAYGKALGLKENEELSRHLTALLNQENYSWGQKAYEAAYEKHTLYGEKYVPRLAKTIRYMMAPGPWRGSCVLMLLGSGGKTKDQPVHKSTEHQILRLTRMLMTASDYEASVNRVLREIGQFLSCDRVYIFEKQGNRISNTFEWCREGVTSEMGRLQDLNYEEYVGVWDRYLRTSSSVVIPDIEAIRQTDAITYDCLKKQNIHSLMEAPMYHDHNLSGYLGVDNYKESDAADMKYLLENMAVYLSRKKDIHDLMDRLRYLSENDMLTGVHNRNAMNRRLSSLKAEDRSLGIIYVDLNNLKWTNDTYGHSVGDSRLRDMSAMMKSICPPHDIYRLGGDEFVAFLDGADEESFKKTLENFRKTAEGRSIHVAVGGKWIPHASSLVRGMRDAEHRMYSEKRRSHEGREDSLS